MYSNNYHNEAFVCRMSFYKGCDNLIIYCCVRIGVVRKVDIVTRFNAATYTSSDYRLI